MSDDHTDHLGSRELRSSEVLTLELDQNSLEGWFKLGSLGPPQSSRFRRPGEGSTVCIAKFPRAAIAAAALGTTLKNPCSPGKKTSTGDSKPNKHVHRLICLIFLDSTYK